MTAEPIVLFVDDAFDLAPFREALSPALTCADRLDPGDEQRVVALVTGVVPIGSAEAAPYPSLRMVLTCSTGTDHLDIEALSGRGLVVCNTPTYCSEEVADHALACVLAGWRGLWMLGADVRAGGWQADAMLRRFDAQRLGIIGLGRIGRALARKAQALGVEVVGFDPWAAQPVSGVRLVDLDELLRMADAVSLHMPGARGAPPVLGAAELALMKPGALLVNCSRASLVDLDAMVAALRSGRLAGAAWDVWPAEPPDADDARLRTPGLLVTPHVGWSSPQAMGAYLAEALAALRAVLLRGEDPPGRVG